MRHFLPFVFFAGLFFAGCDSVSDRISAPFTPAQPKLQVFAADERTTYTAARGALEDIGFRFVRGGPAQGELEALSGLQTGGDTSLNSARQFQLDAQFSAADDGGTQVSVVLHEMVEDDSDKQPGVGTSTALRDSPIFEEFFHAIEHRLAAAHE